MGTIQYDMQMPARFGLTYMGADNAEHMPICIHRALYGSFERFIGILVEHYAGRLPVLARAGTGTDPPGPRVAPGRCPVPRRRLVDEGFRPEVDERDETLGKRIRDAEVEKVRRVVVYGDRESDEALALRERGGGQPILSRGAARAVPWPRRRGGPGVVATIGPLQAGADSFLTSRA